MEWTSAPNTVVAPLPPAHGTFLPAKITKIGASFEAALEMERAQLPLWFVVAFGSGIALWFALPGPTYWLAALAVSAAVALGGAMWPGTRSGRALVLAGIAMLAGLSLAWWRADQVTAPVLNRPMVVAVDGRVERFEPRPARDDVRLTVRTAGAPLPPLVRITVPHDKLVPGLGQGAIIRVRARIQPPPPMALPGTHDFARDLWFKRIGAVGRSLDPPEVLTPAAGGDLDNLRQRLGHLIRERLPGGQGGIATALATGDQAGIPEEDAEAMRRSGLAHLLSVSGLHIAAVVGAAMLLSLRILALSERLALRFNLVLVSAAFGSVAGIGYTLLTGMQVPTVRSCIAAVLVLAGIAMGRDAISLRLVAVGALMVLIVRPESVVGASFQLSFAAVTAIIAFHGLPRVRRWLAPREESWPFRLVRSLAGLTATGLVVELTLMPLALFHFHKAGLYGVAANLIAIPLTTFIIMPLEALALLLDTVGLGGPVWMLCGWALQLCLGVAHGVASAPGSVAVLPSMPVAAFAMMVGGGCWVALWTRRHRWWGIVPVALGAFIAGITPPSDLLVTGDGKHVAIMRQDGVPLLLRGRSGEFVRDLMSEVSAYDGDPLSLETDPAARCSRDACFADITRDGKSWRILAIRSRDRIRWEELAGACQDADIVIADRRLPRGCLPRWLKLDRAALAQTGGVAIHLGRDPMTSTVSAQVGNHPWRWRQ